ncbi:hypothetical protein OF83DRAFT_248299 [Amylostereum chailletii]|nr:hypothetical protein OF83DRAFT_248299 [Amylostereum chailletii]
MSTTRSGAYTPSPSIRALMPDMAPVENKYMKMYKDNPEECAPTLRNLYRSRAPGAYNPELCGMVGTLAEVMQDIVARKTRQPGRNWDVIVSSGLSDVYQEIITDEPFLVENPVWMQGVLGGFTYMATLCNKRDDKALADRLVVANPAVLRALWKGRRHIVDPQSTIQRLTSPGVFFRILSNLLDEFAELYSSRLAMPKWTEVPVVHLSYFCWFHSKEPCSNDKNNALNALLIYAQSVDVDDRNALFKACALDEYGIEECLLRIQSALKVQEIVDDRLLLRMGLLEMLLYIPGTTQFVGKHKLFECFAEAGLRQRARGNPTYLWSILARVISALQ